MVTGGNNAAVAHQYRRCVDNCAFEQFTQFAELAHFIAQLLDRRAADVGQHFAQDRQLLERMTHTGEVARTRGAQRQSRQNTFQIAHLTQHRLQFGITLLQRAYGLLTFDQHRRVAHRHMQPAFEHPAAHRRHGAVEHRRQRIVETTGQVLGNLQVTAGCRVHNNTVLLALHGDGADVRQRGTLGIFDILQQAAGGAQAARGVFDAEADQIDCRFSCWRAVSISNSHSGRRRRPRRPSISDDSAKSSAYSRSAGLVRCSSAAMVSRSAGSLRRKRPELISSVA